MLMKINMTLMPNQHDVDAKSTWLWAIQHDVDGNQRDVDANFLSTHTAMIWKVNDFCLGKLDFRLSLMEFLSFDSRFWTSVKNGAFWVPILLHLGQNVKNPPRRQ